MGEPFFDLPDCPDAAGLVVPDAPPTTPILADCSVPEAPEPVCDCPPPVIAPPPLGGSTLFHVRITGRSGLAHSWQAVESDASGGWVAEGRTGAIGSGAEAYEQSGAKVRPGPKVYLARRAPGSRRVVFTAPRVPFFVRLSGAGPVYDWTAMARNAAHAWVATGESGTAAGGDGAREVNDVDLDDAVDESPDAVYSAQRDAEGNLDVDASTATSGGGGGGWPGGAAGASYWCRSPDSGVLAASGPLGSRTPQSFTADVYATADGAASPAYAAATIYWWLPDACGAGRLLALRPGGSEGTFDAIVDYCTPIPADEEE